MSTIIRFSSEAVRPAREQVLRMQGVPLDKPVSTRTERLGQQALKLLAEMARPVGILAEISTADFAAVYQGEGRNEPKTPVGDIFPRAGRLALFAATLGPEVSNEIARRFRDNDAALAAMLDSAASVAADRVAELLEQHFRQMLIEEGALTAATGVLRYSPGYCGWHVSGQRKLFECLRPEQIGIRLRDSFLMDPLKSVSGVLIAGPEHIHRFATSYPFCAECRSRTCRGRLRSLLESSVDRDQERERGDSGPDRSQTAGRK